MTKKSKIVWFQAVTCNGNTHSLLSASSTRLELFYNSFDLVYHPSLSINLNLNDVLQTEEKIDYLLIEGSITNNEFFFQINDTSTKILLNALASKSKYIIAVGSCASYGGVHKKFQENSDICGVEEALNISSLASLNHPIINLTGCPVHPEWILQTLFSLENFSTIPLDEEGRPVELYSHLAHHGCTRNEYFEWKVEASWGAKEGCLFYSQGCRAPMTHSSCNKILWNDVSSKTRVGMPCIGCTEKDFPRDNMLETKKNIGIPQQTPLGIPKRAYLSISGVAKTFSIDRLNNKLIKYDNENS